MGETPKITFRKMTPDDADAVAEIEIRTFAMPWKRDDFWQEAQNKFTEYIVGEVENKIVAYAGAWIFDRQADITNVAVDENYRGLGFGRKLFAELIRLLQNRGITAVTLEVRPSNTAAIKLYESFGLRSVGRRKKYYTDNDEDALIMWNTKL